MHSCCCYYTRVSVSTGIDWYVVISLWTNTLEQAVKCIPSEAGSSYFGLSVSHYPPVSCFWTILKKRPIFSTAGSSPVRVMQTADVWRRGLLVAAAACCCIRDLATGRCRLSSQGNSLLRITNITTSALPVRLLAPQIDWDSEYLSGLSIIENFFSCSLLT